MSLRTRLLAVVLALMAVGLTVAGWATYQYLHGFLVDRVDQQLVEATGPAVRALAIPGAGLPGRPPPQLPLGTRAELRSASGAVRASYVAGSTTTRTGLPAALPVGISTVELSGGGEYRVLVNQVRFPDPALNATDRIVVAVPLTDVQATLDRLLWIEVGVGAAVLLAAGLLGFWLVRVGLRPLSRIEATAGAIEGGDLSRRVPDAGARTEVGRLGRSINAMLDRIEQAFAERQAAEARLRRFVADASHELQTPLTSVRGYAELFRRGAAENPADLATAMRRIESEATRMGVLVDDLLLLARLDEGRPLEREDLDLGALAGDLVADARAVEPDRPITLEAEGQVIVHGDGMRLRQVLANLLANVRRHTPPGAPASVRVRRQGGEGVLEVADSGPGIDAQAAERVFERFFRADPSRARTSGGSGLGLSIVAKMVRHMGGELNLTNSPSGGLMAVIRLPQASDRRADHGSLRKRR